VNLFEEGGSVLTIKVGAVSFEGENPFIGDAGTARRHL
jgi:hypothetical protein